MATPRRARPRIAAIAGLLAGALAGTGAVVLAGSAVAHRADEVPLAPYLEATHLPPLLTLAGERVELAFDAYCVSGLETGADAPCAADGSVFVRAGDTGPFRELPLVERPAATEGRLAATVPDAIVRSPRGFTYYAVLRDRATRATATVPAGGATAPQRSLPLGRPVEVALGEHAFGRVRPPSARVVDTPWGNGPGEVGLEQGRGLGALGASSFDVDAHGDVYVLDEAHRRILRWTPGAVAPERIPVAIDGTLADLAVGRDGGLHVLESTSGPGAGAVLRSFDPGGSLLSTARVHERAAQVRLDAEGRPVVREQASSQWQRALAADGRPLSPAEQRASGRPGRTVHGQGEIVVLRRAGEALVAIVDAGGARRSWRITSETSLGEVQLAEPVDNRLVVVVRVHTDQRDEFVALVLGDHGLVSRFSVEPADWAETAALSRFRLVGASLFRLGSTPDRMFVDRFDLEVR